MIPLAYEDNFSGEVVRTVKSWFVCEKMSRTSSPLSTQSARCQSTWIGLLLLCCELLTIYPCHFPVAFVAGVLYVPRFQSERGLFLTSGTVYFEKKGDTIIRKHGRNRGSIHEEVTCACISSSIPMMLSHRDVEFRSSEIEPILIIPYFAS